MFGPSGKNYTDLSVNPVISIQSAVSPGGTSSHPGRFDAADFQK